MEHWNKEKGEEPFIYLGPADKMYALSISVIYDYYVGDMKETTHTLEQTMWIAYLDEFCFDEFRTIINQYNEYKEYNKSKKSFKEFIIALNKYRDENHYLPDFESYQKNFKKYTNDFLTAIFGKNTTLKIFSNKGEGADIKDYEIDEEDGTYLAWLYVTRNTQDAQNFLCANYRAVDEMYLRFLGQGAQTLVEKKRIAHMTIEQWNDRFEIDFGLKQRGVKAKFEELRREYETVESIFEEFMDTHLTHETAEERCNQCIDILISCQKQLFDLRQQWMADNKIDAKYIDQFIRTKKSKHSS